MQSAGIARGGMSVRLSVRPSVTLRYCVKTKKDSVMISSPSESQNILVSGNIRLIPKFERGQWSPGARAIYETMLDTNWRFWRFLDLQGTVSPKRCKIRSRLLLITNYRKLHTCFRLVTKPTTLDDPELTLIRHYAFWITLHIWLSEPTTKFDRR